MGNFKEILKLQAHNHHEFTVKNYANESESASATSIVYRGGLDKKVIELPSSITVEVKESDTIGMARSVVKRNKNIKVGVLNFASFKNPGGMFLEGSVAQEESICHNTNLYDILSNDKLIKEFYEPNKKELNLGLYSDNAIFTDNVILFDESCRKPVGNISVITCAAPNAGTVKRYQKASEDEITFAMKKRIHLIINIALLHNIDVLILGAFGCGVFRNDPETVSELFTKEITNIMYLIRNSFSASGEEFIHDPVFDVLYERSKTNKCIKIYFAIPGGKNLKVFNKNITVSSMEYIQKTLKDWSEDIIIGETKMREI